MRADKRDLVSIDDLTCAEITELFHHANRFGENLRGWSETSPGSIMATLFSEPSTRTRLSFESAMLRLGGGVVTAAEVSATSHAKGESLADTVRVVGGSYADILVIRHPCDGAARVAAKYARVPVINGGDGTHEHPTQTLCDLYTLWREKGELRGLDVVLCGDLRFSRTIHSFAYALARFEANIITIPYPGFEMPPAVLERLDREFGVQAQAAAVGDLPGLATGDNSAAYLTASRPHQLALFTSLTAHQVERIDAIYMTRAQRERHSPDASIEGYPHIGPELMKAAALRDARIMHPLPRTDEIAYELDDDPRSVYFRQAEFGVPVRMALMAYLLGALELEADPPTAFATDPGRRFPSGIGAQCRNERCITNSEAVRYLAGEFRVHHRSDASVELACANCGVVTRAGFIGCSTSGRVHAAGSADARRVREDNRVYFDSVEQARVAGFRSA